MRIVSLLRAFMLLLFFWCTAAAAQDTLPRFNVRNAGNNRIIVGWINPFPNLTQVSVQRSFDSLGAYKTIISLADPRSVQNGYTDRNAPNDHMFYRIFYAAEGGSYFFTKPRRPDTTWRQPALLGGVPRPFIGASDVPYRYKDSIVVRNRDTFVVMNHDTVRVTGLDTFAAAKPRTTVVKKPEWTPSANVFTNGEGYVTVRLRDADEKKYSVKFYDGEEFLFELRGIKEKLLILDKSNFYHSGWFNFELYTDDKLLEKSKFYLKP